MEKMYYMGREIVAVAPSPDGRSCAGCVFDENVCTNNTLHICCWSYDDEGEYVEGSDVIFKYKEQL